MRLEGPSLGAESFSPIVAVGRKTPPASKLKTLQLRPGSMPTPGPMLTPPTTLAVGVRSFVLLFGSMKFRDLRCTGEGVPSGILRFP